jgi:hypothetical protein
VKLRGWTTLVGGGLGFLYGLINGASVPADVGPGGFVHVVSTPFFTLAGEAIEAAIVFGIAGAIVGAVIGWGLQGFSRQS